jgi:DNA-binding NarL/FixJ family response regulator
VIILTGRTKEYLIPAIDAGAAGCLDKSVTHEELVMAIRVVHLWRLGLFSPKDDGHFALVKL